jgi:GntR family transcriptional regulator
MSSDRTFDGRGAFVDGHLAGLSHTYEQSVPKYYDLKRRLREELDGLPPGTAVPPERTLSQRFNLARTTVRQALQELAIEGHVVRLRGRGTFVAPPKITQTLQLTSYTEDVQARGLRPSSRLLDVSTVAATGEIAERLQLATGAPVIRIERLRLAKNEPMAIEAVHLDPERFPGIETALSEQTSLYSLMRERYAIIPVDAEETIESVLASPSNARLLGSDSTTPLLLLTRTSWDDDGSAVEFVHSFYRGDRYRFRARLPRPTVDG